jgi:hypothetical protein
MEDVGEGGSMSLAGGKQMGDGPLLGRGDLVRIRLRRGCLCGEPADEHKYAKWREGACRGGLWRVEVWCGGEECSVGCVLVDEFGGSKDGEIHVFSYSEVVPVGCGDPVDIPGRASRACPRCGGRLP